MQKKCRIPYGSREPIRESEQAQFVKWLPMLGAELNSLRAFKKTQLIGK